MVSSARQFRDQRTLVPGRYALDESGVLHAPSDPFVRNIVAMVTVRAKPGRADLSDLPDRVIGQLRDAPGLAEERARRGPGGAPETGRTGQPLQRSNAAAERNAGIVAGYVAGEAVNVLAERFGVSNQRISQIAAAAGVAMRGRSWMAVARARGMIGTAPKTDWNRVADAFDRKHRAANPTAIAQAEAAPLEPALSRESCGRCGIPGWKGCAHQAAYVDDRAEPARRGLG